MPKTKQRHKRKKTPFLEQTVNGRTLHHYLTRLIAIFAVIILASTTVYWSVLGGRVHSSNSDQLVNAYLFKDAATLQQSTLPGQHTSIIKLPFLLLVKYYGYTRDAYINTTVALTLITVLLFAYLLWRLTKHHPLLFGTLCLALASILLLIPAQPYPGALLPMNMAMITTRNLEYAIYLGAIALLLIAKNGKDTKLWGSIALLGALMASDKLFVSLGIGSALVVFLASHIFRRKQLQLNARRWLLAVILAFGFSFGLLWLLKTTNLFLLDTQGGITPYSLIFQPRALLKAVVYGLLATLSNFGANPFTNTTLLNELPGQLKLATGDISIIGFGVNAVILVLVGLLTIKAAALTLKSKKTTRGHIANSEQLNIFLIASSVVAFGAFLFANHYYPVDGRYVTILLFTLFVGATCYLRKHLPSRQILFLFCTVLFLNCLIGLWHTQQSYQQSIKAMQTINRRNDRVADIMRSRNVKILVGDYWRVIPIRQISNTPADYAPLQDCTHYRKVLDSQVWQPDLHERSFAYLLSLDKGLTDYPTCTIDQVTKYYGRPNSTQLIDGTFDQPKELILFYDQGINAGAPRPFPRQQIASSILPTMLDKLPKASCPKGTLMNIVAHEDDDLLFLSPDLHNAVAAGQCVRTIYLTAGDAGSGQFYWLSRAQGSQAAYANMLDAPDTTWSQRTIKIADQQFIIIATSKKTPAISLIYFQLPDGNIKGQGFANTRFENMERLQNGSIELIHSLDGQSAFSKESLTSSISALMLHYSPSEIHTQATSSTGQYPDHADHLATGVFTNQAFLRYYSELPPNTPIIPVYHYLGYGIKSQPENLTEDEIVRKEAAFFAYAQFDGGVCRSRADCEHNPAYHFYLRRQYRSDE